MPSNEQLLINEAQLVLAEQRTHLALLRTGIAILALPMTVVSFLIAMSRFYHVMDQMALLAPLLIACAVLAVLGGYLILRSITRLRRDEAILFRLRAGNDDLAEVLDP